MLQQCALNEILLKSEILGDIRGYCNATNNNIESKFVLYE
jgi:hypothetical protein